jgi:putative ABC transport system permease protein
VGKGITFQSSEGLRDCMIVGVVPHVRYRSPGIQENAFQAYFPYSQWDFDTEFLAIRSSSDPAALIPAVRKVVDSVDPDVPVSNIKTYDDLIAEKLVTRKLSTILVSLFSVVALFLSAMGLYGVLAYSISQRRREIGVRIALGAESTNILRLVIRQGLKLVGVGLVVGIVLASVCARLIEGMLYGVSANDPITLGLTVVVLGLAATAACLLPALRAARINPLTALRE